MSKYHLNWKGEPGACGAQPGNCPFGGDSDHFASPEAARSAYEQQMTQQVATPSLKKKTAAETVMDLHEDLAEAMSNWKDVKDLVDHGQASERELKLARAAVDAVSEELERAQLKTSPKKTSGKTVVFEDWKVVRPEDSKLIVPPKVKDPNGGYMGGSKFVGGKVTEKYMSSKDAAKNIRADIREAIKAGELPRDFSYGVRTNRGSGVSSISILMAKKDSSGSTVFFNEMEEGDQKVLAVKKYLDALGNQYSSKEVNGMVDYFSLHNAASVRFRSKWD